MAMKPVSKKLNEKQKEILARKLGYDGPMNMFEEFVKSDAAMGAKYNSVISKYMARGGMAKKYAQGGMLKMAAGGSVPQQPKWPEGLRYDGKNLQGYIDRAAKRGNPLPPAIQEAANKVGGIDALVKMTNEHMKKEAQYTIDFYKYQYDNNGPHNAGAVASAYEKAANSGLFSSSEVSKFTKEAATYKAEGEKYKKDQEAARSARDAKNARVEQAGPIRTQLYEAATSRYDTAVKTLRNQHDQLIQDIFAKNDVDEGKINAAYDAGQITKEQRTTLREQIQKAEDAAVAKVKQDYATAKGTLQQQYDADFAYADKTFEELVAGTSSTPWTGGATLPEVTQPLPTIQSSYTPLAQEQIPTVQGTPDPYAGMTPQQRMDAKKTEAQTRIQTAMSQPQPTVTTTPVDKTTGAQPPAATTQQQPAATTQQQPAATTTGTPNTLMSATPTMTGTPVAPEIPQIEAAKIEQTPEQMVSAQGAPATAATIQPATVTTAATAQQVAPKPAATIEAATATPGVTTALQGVQPVTGAVSPEAQVQAQTMEPTSTKVSDLTAATGEATMVQAPAPRTVQEGELISGPTVDMGRVEEALAQNVAAQGEVTPEMTIAGQLQKLTADFDATNPPPWAAGAIRGVNAELARRGIGVSSMAGQAVLQAALESALPVAAADAKVFQDMGIQNLSNRQQMAVLSAQQRAAFLGQEFDQAFQTRVTNAATISEIANINFTAEQQIALENARLTNTVNLANLSNQQALIMAEAAQIANLETANLNNRQQAAVLNAQAFLQMDMANLANEQQTELFKAQSMVNSLLTDAASENAARQFNASSINQVNQFYDGLTTQIQQFNAAQINGINQFNVSQVNAVAEFNANSQNARDQFNAEYRRIIDQSNVEWRRNIALADTAAINRANEINAANALGITTIEYNNQWQTSRDIMEMSWKTGESALDRETQLAMQVLQKQATIEAAKFQVEVAKYEALGRLSAAAIGDGGLAGAAAALGITGVARGGGGAGGAPAGTKTAAEKIMDGDDLPTFNGPVYSYNDALGREIFSPEYEQFISNTYGTEIGSEQSEWLAEQDAWFYDGM